MSNLREVNDDILKEWIECRESTIFLLLMMKIKNMTSILMSFLKIF